MFVMLLAAFSTLSVGFSSWVIVGYEEDEFKNVDINTGVGDFIDVASMITYYDGNYEIPPIGKDGFVVDETLVYAFDINFNFRLRVQNNQPNRGLEYYLDGATQFTLKMILSDTGSFKLLNPGYMQDPALTLKVKPESASEYTAISSSTFDNTSVGRINADYIYQNDDILDEAYLDFLLTLRYSFTKNSHFGTTNNIYDAIIADIANSSIDKVIALKHQLLLEV